MNHTACTGRLAAKADLPAVAAIYAAVHAADAAGVTSTGWEPGVYPTRATAEAALECGDLYVFEEEGQVVGSAIINQTQMPAYAQVPWTQAAPPERVLVLHTLAIDPNQGRHGCGSAAVAFYEAQARLRGCPCLRMDTNLRNLPARSLYRRLGYRELGAVECTFNGIPGVPLLMLEKILPECL